MIEASQTDPPIWVANDSNLGPSPFEEVGFRIPYLVDWLGGSHKFRDLNKKDFEKLKATPSSPTCLKQTRTNIFSPFQRDLTTVQ